MTTKTKIRLLTVAGAAALAIGSASPSVAIDPNNTMQGAAAVPIPTEQIPTAPANGELAFVFNDFSPAVLPGMKENCPDGTAFTIAEAFLASLPPAEAARLKKPENEPEFAKRWKASAMLPGKNVCGQYNQFPERGPLKTVQNKVAYGLNLDGDATDGAKDPWTCAHENFTGPSGEKGVDNQVYRALGCTRQFRGPDGGFAEYIPAMRMNSARGEFVQILLLRGVDSLVKDDNVEVILASARDNPIIDLAQNFVAGATYTVSDHAEWRNVLKGRIEDGVFTTEPKDITLKRSYIEGQRKRKGSEYTFDRMRLRLTIRPDGSMQGVMGGYQDPYNYMVEQVGGSGGTVTVAGIDCAAQWNTLVALSDGERDPQTGKCSKISAAWNVHAVPAFVFDTPPQAPKTAVLRE